MSNYLTKILFVITFTLLIGYFFKFAFVVRGIIDCPEEYSCSLPFELGERYHWYFFIFAFWCAIFLLFANRLEHYYKKKKEERVRGGV